MKSSSRSSKRDTWNASSTQQEGKSGQIQSPPAYGISLADSGAQAIQASRGFPKEQKGDGFQESKDKSFHPASQFQLRPADDAYEQQADRLAEKIMTQQPVGEPVKKLNPPAATAKNKKSNQQGEGVDTGIAQEIKNARGKGRPLPEVIRRPAEKALGKDLSRVRLHTGARADQINQNLGAEAAAVNQDIFAAKRAADVHSPDSRAILLHETVHTLQQNTNRDTSGNVNIQRFSIKGLYKKFTERMSRIGSGIHQPRPQVAPQPTLANQGSGIYGAAPPIDNYQEPIYQNVRVRPQGHQVSRVDTNYDVLPTLPPPRPTHAYGQAPSPYEAFPVGSNYQRPPWWS